MRRSLLPVMATLTLTLSVWMSPAAWSAPIDTLRLEDRRK